MTINETTKLALKLAGLYLLIQAIMYVPTFISMLSMLRVPNFPLVNAFAFTAMFIIFVGLGLWLTFAMKPSLPVENQDIITSGFIIGGIIASTLAISMLPINLGKIFISVGDEYGRALAEMNSSYVYMELIGNILQLGIGFIFIGSAKSLTKMVK